MKTFILVIALLLGSNLNGQTVFRLDSLHQYSYMPDETLNNRELYTYDIGGHKETNLLKLSFFVATWDSINQFNKNYNSNNDITQSISQAWDPVMGWLDTGRDTYTYTASNNVDVHSNSIYADPDWLLFSENHFDYDGLGNEIENIFKQLDFMTMMLENSTRYTYGYTVMLRDYWISQFWQAGMWENDEKTDYTYNTNGDVILQEDRTWQTVDWSDPFKQLISTYDTNDQLEEILEQLGSPGNWVNSFLSLFTFTSGNLTEILSQEWNSGTPGWDNLGRILFTYDVDNNATEQIFQSWEPIGMVWENFLRIVNFWFPEDTLSVTFLSEDITTHMYPNPTSDYINIDFKNETSTGFRAMLYDINGKQINQMHLAKGIRTFKMPLHNTNSGMYFLHLNNGAIKQVYKIIKE